MISNYFTERDLRISLENTDNPKEFTLEISSDYSASNRKGRLWVNEKTVCEDLRVFKRRVKTKNLGTIRLEFDGIDHYDDMTDMYDVPTFLLLKGHTNPKVGANTFGHIPKDWEVVMHIQVKKTTTNTAVLEIITKALGPLFTLKARKDLIKLIKPVLRQTERKATLYLEENE